MPVACSAPSTPGRHSSGVERTLGKGEVESSILSGGTISFFSPEIPSNTLNGNDFLVFKHPVIRS